MFSPAHYTTSLPSLSNTAVKVPGQTCELSAHRSSNWTVMGQPLSMVLMSHYKSVHFLLAALSISLSLCVCGGSLNVSHSRSITLGLQVTSSSTLFFFFVLFCYYDRHTREEAETKHAADTQSQRADRYQSPNRGLGTPGIKYVVV